MPPATFWAGPPGEKQTLCRRPLLQINAPPPLTRRPTPVFSCATRTKEQPGGSKILSPRCRRQSAGKPANASKPVCACGNGASGPNRESAREEPPPVLPGFRIERKLGEGSLGVVYAAHDEKLNRRVAIKVLHRRADEAVRRRVLDEARKAAGAGRPGHRDDFFGAR